MNKIIHVGVIEYIKGKKLRVRIVQQPACSACDMADHCHVSEGKVKSIDAYMTDGENRFQTGQEVQIVGMQSQGRLAVVLAFVIPFLILTAVLFTAMAFSLGEPLSALISVAALLPYFILLYLFRDKLRRQFRFYVQPINGQYP
ncbi:MAG: SoxR reducing system RseC family protein [Prevotella sp.]|nr:SoxR reducing system RseC family protein [Prevotella sp.]